MISVFENILVYPNVHFLINLCLDKENLFLCVLRMHYSYSYSNMTVTSQYVERINGLLDVFTD